MTGQFLKFKKRKGIEEYMILNKKNQFLGDICYSKRSKQFLFYPDTIVCSHDIWFAANCLKEIAQFLETLRMKKNV